MVHHFLGFSNNTLRTARMIFGSQLAKDGSEALTNYKVAADNNYIR
jgi:hypothetical protein